MWLSRHLPAFPSPRQILVVVALVAHVLAATGAPVPSPRLTNGRGSIPYPCREHACGCLTSEQCWAGDCCCFTLEQKLAWADRRGIEPPGHVRADVEARSARRAASKPVHSCCQGAECEATPAADPQDSEAAIHWVVGMFTQKCRGEGPAGLLKLEPTAPPALVADAFATPEPREFVRVPPITTIPTSQLPPVRPPRLD